MHFNNVSKIPFLQEFGINFLETRIGEWGVVQEVIDNLSNITPQNTRSSPSLIAFATAFS